MDGAGHAEPDRLAAQLQAVLRRSPSGFDQRKAGSDPRSPEWPSHPPGWLVGETINACVTTAGRRHGRRDGSGAGDTARVNGDSEKDLVFYFRPNQTGLVAGDTKLG